jgi:ATP-dependent RNA helicase RhlE
VRADNQEWPSFVLLLSASDTSSHDSPGHAGRRLDSCAKSRSADMRSAGRVARPHTKEHLLTNSTTFSQLGLNAALLKSLETEGYTTPTPIQARAIPGVLAGRDLLGIAQTGTGKTAAFALPILHRLGANRCPALRQGARALVLSPTRELATQIAQSFKTYGRNLNMSVALMFGGVPHRPQVKAVSSGVDILVATPGRLIQHLEERNVVLAGTEILVLDEADQMLDMGFIRPIRQIISNLSAKRQSLFFSATMPKEIGALAAEMLRNPERVAVTPVAKTADRVRQSVIHVEAPRKGSLLVELFADPAMRRTLVFTRTKRGADRVARHLHAAGIKVAAIHGNKTQGQREAALGAFRNGRIRGLVATDIAARGIDIDEVTHVINYDLPHLPESYVHRIGRTARAGAEGIAISLCGRDEQPLLRDIERLTRLPIASIDWRENTAAKPLSGNGDANGQGADKRRGGAPTRFRGPRNGDRPLAGHSKHRRHRSAAIAR